MTMTKRLLCTGAAGLMLAGAYVSAEPADYSKEKSWLCRGDDPSLAACDVDLTTTVIGADGSTTREGWSADPDAPIDCFYVYPTVSLDETPNSDMEAGPEEYSVVKQQFARMGSVCRTFAPLYRQVTLTALRAGMGGEGEGMKVDRAMGYEDVLAAWNHYLENYNNGRSVVLVGHSQGSGVLSRLVQREIEGEPVQEKILSAMLIGSNIQVPRGKQVGGTFKEMPLCTDGNQTQCIVTYASFRSTVRPPKDSLFGRGREDTVSACTNPAQLAKGGNELHAYLNAGESVSTSSVEPDPWVEDGPEVETPFVSVPGLLSAECVMNERGSYLEITVHGNPNDPRADDIAGDVIRDGEVQAGWGLHLIDVNLGMGDLIDIIEKQRDAYLN